MTDIYQLSKAQLMLRDSVRQLSQQKIKPIAAELEKKEEFPIQVHEWFKKLELYGLGIKEKWGGSGAGCAECAIAIEQVAEVNASCAILLGAYSLGPSVLMGVGNDDQKEKYLTKIATGEYIPCFALTEPEAGSDTSNIRTKAVQDGNDWLISGTKCFAMLADTADMYTVFAKTDPDKGKAGISAFLIEKGAEGLTVPEHEKKMGCRAVHVCEIKMDRVRVPRENMMGERGDGYRQTVRSVEISRFIISARSVGLAQGALDNAIKYAKERIVFGRPIAKFQAIQFMLADMAIQIEAARQLTYKTVAEIDRGNRAEVAKLGSMAKCFAADTAVKVATDALQVFGGYGYMEDYPMAQFYRDAKLLQISEGTSQTQRMIVAHEILK
ncbi:MAG: acyl-CoA dehydrogenase family protein [Deltaproteobacteria bacterium]|nr:acyl-CoA dehydrogenase family protein [Deltaproteobacteria bacterium]